MYKQIFYAALWLLGLSGLLFFQACQPAQKAEQDGVFKVVTTTGMIADAARNIAGPHAQVQALMGPGVDPHLYKASQGDLALLRGADLILYNGLHLEGKMGEVLEKLARQKPVIAVAQGLDSAHYRRDPAFENAPDPHVWFDVKIWGEVVRYTGLALARVDTAHATAYQQNLDQYLQRLDSLDGAVRQSLAQIPAQRRVLITAHDAFGYFGQAYNMEVKGLQGISTLSEFGVKDVKDLVDFMVQRQIPALFVESSVSDKALQAVLQGVKDQDFEARIGGTLYSDAMGPANTPEGTYIGMVHANVQTIVQALR